MATPKHVPDATERVSAYFASLPKWSRDICERLREIVLKSDPEIIEDWKWGPNYYLNGMVCGIGAHQKFVSFVFFQGALLKDKRMVLQANSGTLHNRHIKFTALEQINEDVMLRYLFEAIDNNKKGKKLVKSANKTVPIAPDVKKEFKQAGVLSYFEGLAYSHRKEYMLWIEDCKKDETRRNRIAKAISKLTHKEMMHDKYKK